MSDRYDKDALAQGNGLACPFFKSDAERDKRHELCHPEKGWLNVREILEHVRRIHTPMYYCEYCGHRWTGTVSRKNLPQKRKEHIETVDRCRRGHRGVRRAPGCYDAEVMTEEMQNRLVEMTKIRDVEKKFEKLYEICGKDLPETFHVRPVGAQPVEVGSLELPTPGRTNSNSSTLFDGFQRPVNDTGLASSAVPLRRDTLSTRAQAGSSDALKDSGYGSETHEEKPAAVEVDNVENGNEALSRDLQWNIEADMGVELEPMGGQADQNNSPPQIDELADHPLYFEGQDIGVWSGDEWNSYEYGESMDFCS